MMKKLMVLLLISLLGGCFQAGEFTPERHAVYEMGQPDCDTTPDRCINGVPW